MKPRIQARAGEAIRLPGEGVFGPRFHVFEQKDLDALEAALATHRPLLLKGKPGTGKSQVAHAAAAALRRPLKKFVVDSRTEPRDLLYRIDFVQRLAEAQIECQIKQDKEEMRSALALRRFCKPGPLWWAHSYQEALDLDPAAGPDLPPCGPSERPWDPSQGLVVLIDEMDKAESDVPNGLLEVLGDGCFEGPDGLRVEHKGGAPLVIVTTNQERELPDAFLRRCLVHTLSLPTNLDAFRDHLVVRGAAHFGRNRDRPSGLSEDILKFAAEELFRDRSGVNGDARPGMAEYLDLLRVLATSDLDEEMQRETLEQVRPFIFGKFSEPTDEREGESATEAES